MRSWRFKSRVTDHCVITNFPVPASPCATSNTLRARHVQVLRFSSSSSSSSYSSLLYPSARYLSRSTTSRPLLLTNPHPIVPTRQPTLARTMSSDDSYLAFLNKANEDLNAGRVAPQQQQKSNVVRTEAVDVDVSVPAPLRAIDTYYVSETDEPFEPVVLKWEGATRGVWPNATQFSSLVSPSADLTDSITTLSQSSFDPRSQYTAVFRAVRAAATQASGGGEKVVDESAIEAKVYRVEVGPSRVEYWIVALDVEGGKLVGLKAKAVES